MDKLIKKVNLMQVSITKSRNFNYFVSKEFFLIFYLLIQYALIVYGLFSFASIIVSYVLNSIILFFLRKDEIFYFLIGLSPFAFIYNFSPGSTSLFTFLFLEAVILLFIQQEKHDYNIYVAILSFSIFIVLRLNFDYQNIIKLISHLMLLYYYASNNVSFKNLIMFFIWGLILSSIVGLFKESIPQLLAYYSNLNIDPLSGRARFSGLMTDPNYYTVALFISIFSLLLLYYKEIINRLFWPVFIVLSSFGLLTISKSFILIYIPLLLLLFVILFRKKKKTQLFFYFVSIIILIILSFRGIIESVSLFYSRLFLNEGTTFLTGRDLIWKDYLLFFNENPGVIIFGNNPKYGLVNDKSIHNFFIELIYHLGLIGSSLFITSIIVIFVGYKKNNIKRKLLNYIPLLVMLVLFFFLSMLFNYLLSFYLMLIHSALNLNLQPGGVSLEKN